MGQKIIQGLRFRFVFELIQVMASRPLVIDSFGALFLLRFLSFIINRDYDRSNWLATRNMDWAAWHWHISGSAWHIDWLYWHWLDSWHMDWLDWVTIVPDDYGWSVTI